MLSKEIRDAFVQDDFLIDELREKISLLQDKIKENIKIIVSTDEYINYKENKSTSNLDKLSSLSIVEITNSLRVKLDRLNSLLDSELNKIPVGEYNLILERCRCKHLFYKDSNGDKKCVKCGYSSNLKNMHGSLREFLASQLYIELDNSNDNEECLPKLISNEPYEYICSIVKKVDYEVSNKELTKIILRDVSLNNISIIDSIYSNVNDMDDETRRNYMIYKKILEFDEKKIKK